MFLLQLLPFGESDKEARSILVSLTFIKTCKILQIMKVLSCEEQSTLDENFYPHKNPNIHKRRRESSTENSIKIQASLQIHSLRDSVQFHHRD